MEAACLTTRPVLPLGFTRLRGIVSITELLVGLALVGLIALACGVLFVAAERASQYAQLQAALVQEGELCVERIRRTVAQAYTTAEFPGFIVLEEIRGHGRFPQILIVWYPEVPVEGDRRRPLANELVIFCPNPNRPEELLEIRPLSAAGLCPEWNQHTMWKTLATELITSSDARRVVLTNRLRTVADPTAGPAARRAGVFFFSMLRPSEAELEDFRAGRRPWNSLSWVHGIHGPQFGLRQHWLRMEIQLAVRDDASGEMGGEVFAAFGSAALYYGVGRNP